MKHKLKRVILILVFSFVVSNIDAVAQTIADLRLERGTIESISAGKKSGAAQRLRFFLRPYPNHRCD